MHSYSVNKNKNNRNNLGTNAVVIQSILEPMSWKQSLD